MLKCSEIQAVRPDHAQQMLCEVLPAALAGLGDKDDDVRSAAAEALLPVVGVLPSGAVKQEGAREQQIQELVQRVVDSLWGLLLELDDLSPSTKGVMQLLVELYSREGCLAMNGHEDLGALVPRLWPFISHSITGVRHSAVHTLERLLECPCLPSLTPLVRLLSRSKSWHCHSAMAGSQ
ncbi:hypothetical protein CYMTET_19572 [Cymbomonas tetramitiformis]|uniref:Uncharacterized protein n=1 Tax=Cymbomonas tetramitiformis TaxID=36881 RepID=A0AAE0G5S3_9CHLO|nr:hypothetical protein CYMTET_19572 [Cymbomonas tetramitiformis]